MHDSRRSEYTDIVGAHGCAVEKRATSVLTSGARREMTEFNRPSLVQASCWSDVEAKMAQIAARGRGVSEYILLRVAMHCLQDASSGELRERKHNGISPISDMEIPVFALSLLTCTASSSQQIPMHGKV